MKDNKVTAQHLVDCLGSTFREDIDYDSRDSEHDGSVWICVARPVDSVWTCDRVSEEACKSDHGTSTGHQLDTELIDANKKIIRFFF